MTFSRARWTAGGGGWVGSCPVGQHCVRAGNGGEKVLARAGRQGRAASTTRLREVEVKRACVTAEMRSGCSTLAWWNKAARTASARTLQQWTGSAGVTFAHGRGGLAGAGVRVRDGLSAAERVTIHAARNVASGKQQGHGPEIDDATGSRSGARPTYAGRRDHGSVRSPYYTVFSSPASKTGGWKKANRPRRGVDRARRAPCVYFRRAWRRRGEKGSRRCDHCMDMERLVRKGRALRGAWKAVENGSGPRSL